jgi:probable F420-dependent oxidoreductase
VRPRLRAGPDRGLADRRDLGDGPEGGTSIIVRKEIAAAADPSEERARRVEEFRRLINPYIAAGGALIDDVIDPRETRPVVIRVLEMARTMKSLGDGADHEGRAPLEEARSDAGLTKEENAMYLGLCMFATDYAIRIDELARAAEERGFESLFVTEHTHIPTSRRTPFPGGGELPKEYSHTFDPFVSLMAAAAATTRLKVGTGICLIIERDTITTAKEVASLDLLSGGRFLFGIGAGWNAEEMENHGTVYKTRYKRMREQVLAMKEIWTKDAAQFHGEHVKFDPIWSWPKPAQTPHPPVLLGGESGHTLQRVVDFCEGWFPRGRAGDVILSGVKDLQVRAARAGRDMKTISVSVFGAKPDEATLETYAGAAITRSILRLPSEGREVILPLLDQYAKLIR